MQMNQKIETILDILTQQEAQVVCMYFGIGIIPLAVKEIGKRLKKAEDSQLPMGTSLARSTLMDALYKIRYAQQLDAFVQAAQDTIRKSRLAEMHAFFKENHLSICQFMRMDNVDDYFRTLPQREEKVIRLRYGIGIRRKLPTPNNANYPRGQDNIKLDRPKNGHTLQEIADAMGTTQERVRQVEAKALCMMRREGRLDAFVALFENGQSSEELLTLARVVLGSEQLAALKIWDPESSPVERPLNSGPIPQIILHPVIRSSKMDLA